MHRTRYGLELRAVGENPQAADAGGINVILIRFCAVVIGGALIGLAGGYLSVATAKIFVFEMTQGRGWIAIALVIFARWMPWKVVLGGLLFGSIEALIPRVLAAGFFYSSIFSSNDTILGDIYCIGICRIKEIWWAGGAIIFRLSIRARG